MRHLRRALRQLVEAVAALHDACKLHRDLKPSNVLVTPEARVVEPEFGLVSNATFIDPDAEEAERTIGRCMFGTPAYMSPEQAAGEALTPAFFFQAVDGIRYLYVTGVQTCALPILMPIGVTMIMMAGRILLLRVNGCL